MNQAAVVTLLQECSPGKSGLLELITLRVNNLIISFTINAANISYLDKCIVNVFKCLLGRLSFDLFLAGSGVPGRREIKNLQGETNWLLRELTGCKKSTLEICF